MRWDAPPTDPIEDIRRSIKADEDRARQLEAAAAFARARYAAFTSLARERQTSGAAKAALASLPDDAKNGNVWLADEHGLLVGEAGPIVVPRWIAVGLGATFEKAPAPLPGETAVIATGVKAPKEGA